MTSRIDIIGQNGGEGEHYLVELVAKAIAGEHAERVLMGKQVGKRQWQLHIAQAIRAIEIVRDWEGI